MRSTMTINKKAVVDWRVRATAANRTITPVVYQTATPDVKRQRNISPDRPPQPSTDGAELGLLVLALQRRDIPRFARYHAWGLIDAWLRQRVDARLAREAV